MDEDKAAPAIRVPLWLLVLLCALAPLSMDAMLPSLPALAKAMAAPPWAGQMVLTTFLLGFAFGQLFWGPLADRLGRRPILVTGLSAYGLTVLGVLLVPEVWVVLTLRFVAGATACAGMVIAKAMVMDAIPNEQRTRAIGYITSALFLAPSLGPTLGGFLQSLFGWRAIFVVLLLLTVLLSGYILFRQQETMRQADPDALKVSRMFGNWWLLLCDVRFRAPTLVVAFMSTGLFAFITGSPLVLMRDMGLNPSSFGIAYMFVTIGFIVGVQVSIRLLPHFEGRTIVAGSLLIAILGGFMMLALAWVPELSPTDRLVWFVAGGFTYYLSLGLSQPISMAAGLKDFQHIAGSASSLQGFLQMTLGAAASAAVSLFDFDMIDGIGMFMGGASVLSALLLARRIRLDTPEDPLRAYASGHVMSG